MYYFPKAVLLLRRLHCIEGNPGQEKFSPNGQDFVSNVSNVSDSNDSYPKIGVERQVAVFLSELSERHLLDDFISRLNKLLQVQLYISTTR